MTIGQEGDHDPR